jgi:hypothetical protein
MGESEIKLQDTKAGESVESISDRCRRTYEQNCHICEAANCGDNLVPSIVALRNQAHNSHAAFDSALHEKAELKEKLAEALSRLDEVAHRPKPVPIPLDANPRVIAWWKHFRIVAKRVVAIQTIHDQKIEDRFTVEYMHRDAMGRAAWRALDDSSSTAGHFAALEGLARDIVAGNVALIDPGDRNKPEDKVHD